MSFSYVFLLAVWPAEYCTATVVWWRRRRPLTGSLGHTDVCDGVPAEAMTDREHGCWGFPGQLLWKTLSRLEITASSWLVVSGTQRSPDGLELFTKPGSHQQPVWLGCLVVLKMLHLSGVEPHGALHKRKKGNKVTNLKERKRRNLRANCRGGPPSTGRLLERTALHSSAGQ